MRENEIIHNDEIHNRIFTLRNVQVMRDKDLAQFYGVKPIRLREQVKRNIKRFPSDFMFQLTEEEVDLMVSQNAIP
ncbi:MAG: ORF6N domain-containing protein [Syntrophales bacterium]